MSLKDHATEESAFRPLQTQFDAGSKATGVAIIWERAKGPTIIFFGEMVRKRVSNLDRMPSRPPTEALGIANEGAQESGAPKMRRFSASRQALQIRMEGLYWES
ncbi:MAG: hypothetical protein M1493_10805 [Firmicutes bacterium]|jgi:hypothetical protein|uniref:Uncharacterized protein n=1 Tax=Sulfobacillus benefaciens TaxID=453960 RepID=A0A2T2XAM0_9FIRM|nr:hypothetical protein [Bacillota bacterium]PSR31561.1 MAG: hypothetical protein C7B43_02385 [Sulfobacillus benefaciens]